MKLTLLEIAQDILNDLDGDEVNSIDDTFESQQVAQIIKTCFFEMMSNRNWPHLRRSVSLVASGNTAYPTHMSISEDVKELCFINYNKAKVEDTRRIYSPVRWAEPDDFLRLTNRRNSDMDDVDVIQDYTGVELLILNDTAPTYFTSFDDKNLVFDAYDKGVDNTLQQSKVQAQAYVMPEWEVSDDFVPDLPSEAFSALVEEAKRTAMFKLKQVVDSVANLKADRQQRWLSRKAWAVDGGIRYPNYGRSVRGGYRDSTFKRDKY